MENLKNPMLKNVESGQLIEIVKSPFSIGRGLSSDYVIENKIVSRTHCSLTKNEGGWTLTDSSTNGTLVNNKHYKGETSPILKHNDEISLGFQSYTYTFIIEDEKVPNAQVERLKSQELSAITPSNEILNSRSPGTPNSFDENGISDELLNNVADNMLNNVEQHTNRAESQVVANAHSVDLISDTRDVAGITNVNQETNLIPNSNVSSGISSIESQLEDTNQLKTNNIDGHQSKESQVVAIDPSECCNFISEQPKSDIENHEVRDAVNSISNNSEQPQSCDTLPNQVIPQGVSDEKAQTDSGSSVGTIIYSLPDEMSLDMPKQPVDNSSEEPMEVVPANTFPLRNMEIQQFNTVSSVGNVSKGSLDQQSNIASLVPSSINIANLIPPRNNFDETIESVVQGSSGLAATTSSTNIAPFTQQNNGIASNVGWAPLCTNASLIPTSINITNQPPPRDHLAETIESVVQGSSGLEPTKSSANTPIILKAGSNITPFIPTTVTVASPLNINKKIKVMAVSPSIISQLRPVTGQVVTAFTIGSGQQLRRLTTSEAQQILANQTRTPVVRLNNIPVRFASQNSPRPTCTIVQNSPTHSHTDLSNLKVYKSSRGRPSTSVSTGCTAPTSNTNKANSTVFSGTTLFKSTLGNVTTTTTTTTIPSLVVSENAMLRPIQNQAATSSITAELEESSIDILNGVTVPAAQHEVVIENTIETTGNMDVVVSENIKVSALKNHNSQEPSTSKACGKKEPGNSKHNNQNHYEEMENEMMCTICANLFIKAVTLGCSHSFCQYCIEQWKKKKSDCPICRNKITSTIRTLVLDNIIEKMLENASKEDQEDRKVAMEERKKLEDAEASEKTKKNEVKRGNVARRGRRNTRGSQRNQNNTNQRSNDNTANNNNNNQPVPVVVIPDSPSTTESDSDNSSENDEDYDYDEYYDDEWYNGRPGAYYGGYGRCFICGDRGHWANGCPNRY